MNCFYQYTPINIERMKKKPSQTFTYFSLFFLLEWEVEREKERNTYTSTHTHRCLCSFIIIKMTRSSVFLSAPSSLLFQLVFLGSDYTCVLFVTYYSCRISRNHEMVIYY